MGKGLLSSKFVTQYSSPISLLPFWQIFLFGSWALAVLFCQSLSYELKQYGRARANCIKALRKQTWIVHGKNQWRFRFEATDCSGPDCINICNVWNHSLTHSFNVYSCILPVFCRELYKPALKMNSGEKRKNSQNSVYWLYVASIIWTELKPLKLKKHSNWCESSYQVRC